MALPIPDRNGNSVSMDLITSLPVTNRDNSAILVMVGRPSKMVHLAATTNSMNAVGISDQFVDDVIRLHGCPRGIVLTELVFRVSCESTASLQLGGSVGCPVRSCHRTKAQSWITARACRLNFEDFLEGMYHSLVPWDAVEEVDDSTLRGNALVKFDKLDVNKCALPLIHLNCKKQGSRYEGWGREDSHR